MFNKENWLKKAEAEYNGCPLFVGREKGDLNDIVGESLTLSATYKFTSEDGDYHAFVVEEHPDRVYMSGGALKKLLNEAEENDEIDALCDNGLMFVIEPTVKVKSQAGRTFRPISVLGFRR